MKPVNCALEAGGKIWRPVASIPVHPDGDIKPFYGAHAVLCTKLKRCHDYGVYFIRYFDPFLGTLQGFDYLFAYLSVATSVKFKMVHAFDHGVYHQVKITLTIT